MHRESERDVFGSRGSRVRDGARTKSALPSAASPLRCLSRDSRPYGWRFPFMLCGLLRSGSLPLSGGSPAAAFLRERILQSSSFADREHLARSSHVGLDRRECACDDALHAVDQLDDAVSRAGAAPHRNRGEPAAGVDSAVVRDARWILRRLAHIAPSVGECPSTRRGCASAGYRASSCYSPRWCRSRPRPPSPQR